MTEDHCVWRFGYGSNIALSTLRTQKNLDVRRHLVGIIQSTTVGSRSYGWDLYFSGFGGHVEPAYARIRPVLLPEQTLNRSERASELHGSAFLIPKHEAERLDSQERGYNVLPSRFVSYDGEVVDVGVYAPKRYFNESGELTIPDPKDTQNHQAASLRYMRLIQQGAREAGLSDSWIAKLDAFPHYITPMDVRRQTLCCIEEFHSDPKRKDVRWTMQHLSKHDGSNGKEHPVHVAVMQYIIKVEAKGRLNTSWKGHCITRNRLLYFRGENASDVRWNAEGFRPLPRQDECTAEEMEYLLQSLETLLHGNDGVIVALLKECIEDGGEMNCFPRGNQLGNSKPIQPV
eukprot:m.166564 g.166564  ORF g.166564 m.166564 type:complete len:345 (-) comp31431_c0_seq1:94-1128(-)